jgi:hypothetical protein
MPTEGGNTGTWDTILNALFQDVDDQMFLVEAKADVASASGVGDFLLSATGALEGWPAGVPENNWYFTGGGRANTDSLPNDLFFRLPSLPVGHVIDAIRSYGNITAGPTFTVSLLRLAQDGTITVVNAGHNLPTVAGETETTGIAHVILAETDYFIRVQRSAGTNTLAVVKSVGYTVEAAP